jgi:hypothetical protein
MPAANNLEDICADICVRCIVNTHGLFVQRITPQTTTYNLASAMFPFQLSNVPVSANHALSIFERINEKHKEKSQLTITLP